MRHAETELNKGLISYPRYTTHNTGFRNRGSEGSGSRPLPRGAEALDPTSSPSPRAVRARGGPPPRSHVRSGPSRTDTAEPSTSGPRSHGVALFVSKTRNGHPRPPFPSPRPLTAPTSSLTPASNRGAKARGRKTPVGRTGTSGGGKSRAGSLGSPRARARPGRRKTPSFWSGTERPCPGKPLTPTKGQASESSAATLKFRGSSRRKNFLFCIWRGIGTPNTLSSDYTTTISK